MTQAERFAEVDRMADWAQGMHGPAVLTMSTPALLAEVDAGLAMRVVRQQTTARDVLLVQALTARLRTASAPVLTQREALEGMLLIDIADERHATAPVLRFDGVERRHA